MNKLLYVIFSSVLIIGGIRVINTKTYEFRYYSALELGEYSLPIGLIIIILGLLVLYYGYIFREQKVKYSKCPKCKKSYNYSELKDGMCPTCNVKTIDMDEYFKKFPEELNDIRE